MNEKTAWLMTFGEYDDYSVLGVFFGSLDEAIAKAKELTLERAESGDWSSDLIVVRADRTEVLS